MSQTPEKEGFFAAFESTVTHPRVLDEFITKTDCGFLDGGCVLLANCLRENIPGCFNLTVLDKNGATHMVAALPLPNKTIVLDGLGATDLTDYPQRLQKKEGIQSEATRPAKPTDLPEANKLNTPENRAWLWQLLTTHMEGATTEADAQTLRHKTNCGIMRCRHALKKCRGDITLAEGYLKFDGCAVNVNPKPRAKTTINPNHCRLAQRADGYNCQFLPTLSDGVSLASIR